MALAARCPHCRALFRVVADQLKLRGGLVRCGECRQVFDAIGSLSYVDDVALAREKAEAAIGGAAHPGPAVAAPPPSAPPPPAREAPKPAPPRVLRPVEVGRRAAARAPQIRDELAVPTLIGIAEPQEASNEEALESALAVAGYHPRGAPDGTHETGEQESGEGEPEAPSFLPTPDQQRAQRLDRALAIACGPLALLAVIQLALTLRADALETWPSLRPALVHACSVFGCKASWPAHAELLTIVGSELEAVPGTDVIELDAAVRSRANFIMALPAIEVTLTDTLNRTVARKVFLPVDYLASSGEPSSRIDEGLAPGSDLSVRLVFEARGLSASGFVLYPFYL
ncbi:MAG TPA: DUF3426 domain-containing protein [Burkholderiaceae bacterium]|nr:DUF3426 domain-containing protein [Burkholderiaceae bacterium]